MSVESAPPAITVLIPVYNGEEYLREAVESILNQSFRDFEALIIDDGSTDGSLAILNEFAAQDERVRIISRENRGLVATLNEGIEQAKAPLIARMDADDIALPERFALQVAYLTEHPEVVCVGGRYINIDEKNRILTYMDHLPTDDEGVQQALLAGNSVLCHPCTLFRRDDALAVGGYDPETMLAEDLDLWLRLGERGKLGIVPDYVLHYREHSGSLSSGSHGKQLEVMRQVCAKAGERRGVSVPFECTGWRPTNRSELYDRMRARWWSGYARGYRSMALDYAWQAIKVMPWNPNGWWLMLKSILLRKRTDS